MGIHFQQQPSIKALIISLLLIQVYFSLIVVIIACITSSFIVGECLLNKILRVIVSGIKGWILKLFFILEPK